MNNISFDGIGAVVATFSAGEGVKGGQAVKLSSNGQVAPCGDGEALCGVALEPRSGLAAVQVKGFVTLPSSGGLTIGWNTLVGDGSGGIKAAEGGVSALVVSVDSDGTAVVCL